MSNFMKAFDEQRDSYLAHYGVKGMQWGVRNEEEPVGQQPAYSEQDAQSMKQVADKVKNADAETVKEKRKRIVKNIIKGVAIGAIVAGITVGAVKGYAKKQTGEKQDLATSLGIIGQKISKKPGQIGDAVKKGFNMNTEETLKNNQEARKEARAAKFDAAKTKFSDMLRKQQEATAARKADKREKEMERQAFESTLNKGFTIPTSSILGNPIAEAKEKMQKKKEFESQLNKGGFTIPTSSILGNPVTEARDNAKDALERMRKIDRRTGLLKNRFYDRGYVETKNSRVYRSR